MKLCFESQARSRLRHTALPPARCLANAETRLAPCGSAGMSATRASSDSLPLFLRSLQRDCGTAGGAVDCSRAPGNGAKMPHLQYILLHLATGCRNSVVRHNVLPLRGGSCENGDDLPKPRRSGRTTKKCLATIGANAQPGHMGAWVTVQQKRR
jgi:hypothetical protein